MQGVIGHYWRHISRSKPILAAYESKCPVPKCVWGLHTVDHFDGAVLAIMSNPEITLQLRMVYLPDLCGITTLQPQIELIVWDCATFCKVAVVDVQCACGSQGHRSARVIAPVMPPHSCASWFVAFLSPPLSIPSQVGRQRVVTPPLSVSLACSDGLLLLMPAHRGIWPATPGLVIVCRHCLCPPCMLNVLSAKWMCSSSHKNCWMRYKLTADNNWF